MKYLSRPTAGGPSAPSLYRAMVMARHSREDGHRLGDRVLNRAQYPAAACFEPVLRCAWPLLGWCDCFSPRRSALAYVAVYIWIGPMWLGYRALSCLFVKPRPWAIREHGREESCTRRGITLDLHGIKGRAPARSGDVTRCAVLPAIGGCLLGECETPLASSNRN